MLVQELKDKNVKSVLMNGIEYFDVKDIRDNHPDLKIDIKKILIVRRKSYITANYVEQLTDFDKVFKGLFESKG
ncbi:hypothetical protein ASG22_04015 [Chryseobacterium sp. Leaf405]|uniref:hypothetical protein n=1 Tax=Chryseobacterium sp. Leaf405 TaxID=1736367 RepID=UPI0006F51D6C|nr:hypothetical protein [Chryseobacterium sp. Leaf405]KQT25874.1 hypothetical protein ASG22_04015 [Chryseobacterium sp. Leaf405]